MSLQSLFPHLRGFRLLAFSREPERLVVTCERITPCAPCPLCGKAAYRIHSRDPRTVADVPVQRTAVLLILHVRKFYCDQPTCPRRIFDLSTSPGHRTAWTLHVCPASLGSLGWGRTRWGARCPQCQTTGSAGQRACDSAPVACAAAACLPSSSRHWS
jgi:hypothetical protein